MLRYTQHDTILRATVRLRDGVIPPTRSISVGCDDENFSSLKECHSERM